MKSKDNLIRSREEQKIIHHESSQSAQSFFRQRDKIRDFLGKEIRLEIFLQRRDKKN